VPGRQPGAPRDPPEDRHAERASQHLLPETQACSLRRSKRSRGCTIALLRCQHESPCRRMWRASDPLSVPGSVHSPDSGSGCSTIGFGRGPPAALAALRCVGTEVPERAGRVPPRGANAWSIP
jgi:hypothetical protein